jgi:hypothetical protein
MLLALLIEIPYDLLTSSHINLVPLSLNLLFPPIYLAVVGLSTRIPDERNTKKIVNDIKLILYGDADSSLKYIFKDGAQRGSIFATLFNFLYVVTFVVSIGLLVWMLSALDFNVVDSAVFFIFLSTVSFFGFRITSAAKELVVVSQKRNFMYAFFDFLYTPFITIGQWLSDKYSKINFLTFFLDFIIEAPLKTILTIFDQWTEFIRDKKDDLI